MVAARAIRSKSHGRREGKRQWSLLGAEIRLSMDFRQATSDPTLGEIGLGILSLLVQNSSMENYSDGL